MFDASAKFISAGWFDGSTYNLGNFDECVDVEVFEGDDYIQGQYCLVEIEINPMADSKYRSREHDFNESSWDTLQASQTLNSSPISFSVQIDSSIRCSRKRTRFSFGFDF